MKRHLGIFLRGAGMGAADAVPGVSGGTIAFVTGIYEELIHSIKQFGPSAYVAWRRGGLPLLVAHLNLTFVLPLLAGIAISLISVAHLVVWLLDDFPLMLDGFFFGLVAASAVVVSRHPADWQWWHLLPLVGGLLLAHGLPSLMPLVSQLGSPDLVLVVGGAIAISALLLPGVSGSFLLLTMGLYGTVMQGIRGFDLGLIGLFGVGCLIGLFGFSRLLSWLLRHYHTATLQLLVGFIIGSLPVLWPWRELVRYQLGTEGQMIPLDYRYLTPADFAELTGEPARLPAVVALMLVGAALVLLIGRANRAATPGSRQGADKEEGSDA
ncbi:putative membrane protein [Halomonas fontilapidosi]|uniref:Putative membrane protein n=1 Tax=Halomonas fontilapidosi TaxID=616675 RepID=A0A7W5DMG5_9GAMM|nr:putative membrane protein [Halomonas fontilapidosi]